MAIEVTMPQMGADMTEGTLVRWVKQVGEQVSRGEVLAEIETDKATVELEAFESGIVRRHVVEEGETVPVGEVIAILGEENEAVPDVPRMAPAVTPARRVVEAPGPSPDGAEAAPPPPPQPAPEESDGAAAQAPSPDDAKAPAAGAPSPGKAKAAVAAEAPSPGEAKAAAAAEAPSPGEAKAPAAAADGARLRISPVARRVAQEAGIDLTAIAGSGPDGRILRRDVEAAVRDAKAAPRAPETAPEAPPAAAAPAPEAPAPAPEAPAPAPEAPAAKKAGAPAPAGLSRMRQAIARRMTLSKQTQPHYYLTVDIDMTSAMEFRKQVNASASEDQRVSVNDLVVKACALALQRHPKFNSEFHDDGLRMHESINIDIGIALDDGLIAPALLDCAHKTLGAIASESKDLVERAKNGHLRAEEYSAGTFTITNLGAYGVEALIGIINPPQAAILGVGTVLPKPVVHEDAIAIRQVMKVALSADHRVSDGAEGARFIKEIQGLLENPVSLAL